MTMENITAQGGENIAPVEKPKRTHVAVPDGHARVGDKNYPIPDRYTKGYRLKETEAKELNRALARKVGSAFAAKAEKEPTKDFSSEIASFVENFQFGESRRGGRPSGDPVERELFTLAKQAVLNGLRAKGRSAKVPTEELNAAAMEAIARHPEWRKIAEDNVVRQAQIQGQLTL
jgi:hypothetical protein